ncbi:PTS system, N-acetylmuramic acid-specific EIIBC component [Spiroplasma sp. NBRC 100390]|uniref:PTS transporter subunit EIIC n=1 Tax=unclassified Spiroplasma TaxID=2637901 RepID=UPI00089283B3|nr:MULTISPECIES: PTS transporter subunit EIIC [unclassified Spiroplasma]AOX44132.1 PTS system, N-acetylmuramic acid-specific EIIBC component [Spiroplasma sp. TU-14]APE13602.1 PTS system, N-acetylmuramic acid-specific EIIBC component [Spiroplasma sp. NBRC 100390]
MAKDPKKTAKDIADIVKPDNVVSYTNCLTRLRLNLKPGANVDLEKLKTTPNVMGILTPSPTELQIVLGPGFVANVTQAFGKLVNAGKTAYNENDGTDQFVTAAEAAQAVKGEMKAKQNWVQTFFTKFSKIFSPMIIGFIGAGILSGIAGIMQSVYGGVMDTNHAPAAAVSWFNALNLILNIWKNAFIIIVGWRTCEVWGGSGVLGAMTAAIYSPVFVSSVVPMLVVGDANHVNYLGINISNPLTNWLTVGFRPELVNGKLVFGNPSGNILGALLTATAALWMERGVRKFMPGVLDTIGTPTLVLFGLLLLNIFLLIPISGYLYQAVAWFFAHLYTNPFGAFVLAAIFLIAVAFGVHQGFIPIYGILIKETGVNGLFPILGMAGMAQVGAGIALWIMATKGSLLRRQIQGALIPAIFGIGEPMIYGVTLPRIRPFVTASIGAGFGGFFIGAVYMWGHVTFGLNAMFGPSGILATFMMTTDTGNIPLAVGIYLVGSVISVAAGWLITMFGYSRIVKAGGKDMKELYRKDGKYKLYQKILWTLAFITIIGIFIYWTVSYYQLPKEERSKMAHVKVE